MTIFERLWVFILGVLTRFWGANGEILMSCLKQYMSKVGEIVLADAAQWSPVNDNGTTRYIPAW